VVLFPFRGYHDRLLSALEGVEPRDLGTDLTDAAVLLKAQGAAAAGRDVEVLVLSDGAFADPGGIEGMRVFYVPFGEAKDNAGITDLRVSRGADGTPSLAVAAEAFGSTPLKRTLSLRLGEDGRVLDARAAEAPAGQQAFVLFPLDAVPPGPLEVRLEGEDALAADDRAFVVHRPEPPRRYAIFGKSSRWLRDPSVFRAALEGSPVPVTDAAALAALGPFDLLICNGDAPNPMPAVRAAIFIGCVPPDGPVKAIGTLEYPPVIDWSRTHPITRHCEFSDLLVVEALRLDGVPAAGVLVDSPQGPLAAFVETPDRQSLFLPFDLDKSNLPLRLAFPLLLPNALDHFFASRRPGDDEDYLRTGKPLERALPPNAEMTVTPPGGKPAKSVSGPGGTAIFRDTVRAGLYQVETPKGPGFAAASLVRRAESDIAPRPRVEAGGVVHEADPESVKANVPLRDTLLLLAAGILLLEWLLWSKRR
jgi:Ca-activated chloride channel family protein